MAPDQTPRRPLAIIFSIVLVNSIGFGIIMPVMPQLIMDVADIGLARAAMMGGLLWFAYAVMQFTFSPVLGNLADAVGRRPVLLVSLLAFAIDYTIMGFAPEFAWLVIGRMIAGVASATNSVANSYVADISPPSERAGNFGIMGAAFGVGFIVGPAIGGVLADLGGVRAPFFGAGALGLLNFLFVAFALEESLKPGDRQKFQFARANPLGAFRHFKAQSTVVTGLLLVVFVMGIAQFVLPTTWSFYTIERFSWSPTEIGLSLSFVGVLMVIVQGVLVRRVVERIGRNRAAILGVSFTVMGYLGYAFAPYGWMMYVVILFHSMSGFSMPAIQALITQRVDASSQGALQGAVGSANGLAAVIGPPLMTVLFGLFSDPSDAYYFPGVGFVLAAGLAGIALLILLRVVAGAARAEG